MAASGNCEKIDLSPPQPRLADSEVHPASPPCQQTPPPTPHISALSARREPLAARAHYSDCGCGADCRGCCCCYYCDFYISSPPAVPACTATSADSKEEQKEEEPVQDLDSVCSVRWIEPNLSHGNHQFYDIQRNSCEDNDQRLFHSGSADDRPRFGLSRRWPTLDYSSLSFEECDNSSAGHNLTPCFQAYHRQESTCKSGRSQILLRSISENSALFFRNNFPLLSSKPNYSDYGTDDLLDSHLVGNGLSWSNSFPGHLKQLSVSLPSLSDEEFSALDQYHGWTTVFSYIAQYRRRGEENSTGGTIEQKIHVTKDRPRLKRLRAFGGFSESITEEESLETEDHSSLLKFHTHNPESDRRKGPVSEIKTPESDHRKGPVSEIKTPESDQRKGPVSEIETPESDQRKGPVSEIKTPESDQRKGSVSEIKTPESDQQKGPVSEIKPPESCLNLSFAETPESSVDPDTQSLNDISQSYMNGYLKLFEICNITHSNEPKFEIIEDRVRGSRMKRSSSEGRTRPRARFSSDVDSTGYSDKRHSDSEGSDTYSHIQRGRTGLENKSRSNVAKTKKASTVPSGNSAAPVKQRTTKLRQPKQPEVQGTPATQRKTKQRRILPSVGATQQKAPSKDVNGLPQSKAATAKKPQYSRSLTMSDIDRKTEVAIKTDKKVPEADQDKAKETSETVEDDSASKETSQRRSIMRVMRRPTEVSDAHIYTMKPSDVRLNKGVWSEAKPVEEDEVAEEEIIKPSLNSKNSSAPIVPPRPSLIPKSVAQTKDEQKETVSSVVPALSMTSYSVDAQPGSVTTSAMIHLTSNTSAGEEDTVDNTKTTATTTTPTAATTPTATTTPTAATTTPTVTTTTITTTDTVNNISNGNSPIPHYGGSLDSNTYGEINGINNNDMNQSGANPTGHSPEINVLPATPSKSNSEPTLNVEESGDKDRISSTFRRPRDNKKSKFSASENLLTDVPRVPRTHRSAPTTPAQSNTPIFPKSSTGSDGSSSGAGSYTSTSLPPGAPWSRETWTSRKRYEIAHCEHDHFLASLSQYASDLKADKPSRPPWKNHAQDHARCYHTNGSLDIEHFRTDHHCNRDHGKGDNGVSGPYLTPRQRLEKETRMLKREVRLL